MWPYGLKLYVTGSHCLQARTDRGRFKQVVLVCCLNWEWHRVNSLTVWVYRLMCKRSSCCFFSYISCSEWKLWIAIRRSGMQVQLWSLVKQCPFDSDRQRDSVWRLRMMIWGCGTSIDSFPVVELPKIRFRVCKSEKDDSEQGTK